MTLIPCGLDLGNRRTKIHLLGKSASIPSVIGFDKPIVLGKNETEIKSKAFSLLFRVDNRDHELWFGRDVLASQSILQEIDDSKYAKAHIQRLFQAVLYEWSTIHKQALSQLGKLNIVTSMPPGQYQKNDIRRKAEKAYRAAFNTGQSHMKLRPKGDSIQIVTQFDSLVKEASLYGKDIPRSGQLVLVVDLGGGTTDFVLFNGSDIPVDSRSINNGLFHVYQKIDMINPQRVELRIMSNKQYWPNQLISYYNSIRLMVSGIIRTLPSQQIDRVDIIGGGAGLMPSMIQSQFKQLAGKVYIRDQYVNAIANWKKASK